MQYFNPLDTRRSGLADYRASLSGMEVRKTAATCLAFAAVPRWMPYLYAAMTVPFGRSGDTPVSNLRARGWLFKGAQPAMAARLHRLP